MAVIGTVADMLGCGRQGCYAASDVTILTPYTGQLLILKAELASYKEGFMAPAAVRPDTGLQQPAGSSLDVAAAIDHQTRQLSDLVQLKTVDNFQGKRTGSWSIWLP